ncbi:MAG: GvpL/GvpF family gas vesicle protein [Candidatus Bathyarchaeota archaeon]|nr:GvpL/GvpF family gas vesicle protein [Candidatus Bathyarchaeota archaeon]
MEKYDINIDDCNVYAVTYKDLAAVVSDDLGRNDIIRDMMAHEVILEKLMEKYTVIPLRFGHIAKSREEVKGFLIKNYRLLKGLAARLRGKVELNLKLFWKDTLFAKIASENLTVRVLAKETAKLPERQAYPMKVRIGQIVEKEMAKLRERIVGEILSVLNPISVDVRENELLTREMVLNASFLVDKPLETKFDGAVEDLERRYGELLAFKYVKSPPYSFTTVKIGVTQHAN